MRCIGTPIGPPSRRWCRMFSPTASPRLFMPSFARMPASVIVTQTLAVRRARPSRRTQRSGASTYQSQFWASHGPSARVEARDQRAPARARDLGARVQRADQLGRDARAVGDALHLLAPAAAASARRGSARPRRAAAPRRVRARATSRRARGTSAAPPRSARRARSPPRAPRAVGSSSLVRSSRRRASSTETDDSYRPRMADDPYDARAPLSGGGPDLHSPRAPLRARQSATSRGCPTPSRSCSRTCCATPAAST